MGTLYRYAAFTDTQEGGNPAGVWIGDTLPTSVEMQAIAAEVGYSETAFVTPVTGAKRMVRYYSPEKEITFCGHATIASAVALANRGESGIFTFDTLAGEVVVEVEEDAGRYKAALTSVEPQVKNLDLDLLDKLLSTMNLNCLALDEQLPPMLGFAGAWHLIIAVKELSILNALEYDFDLLKSLMLANDLTTIQVVFRESEDVFHSRNPFPVGGVVEDPATGAAAAALGGYLRENRFVQVPMHLVIRQGEAMGRPSLLQVTVPVTGGIRVAGTAVVIES